MARPPTDAYELLQFNMIRSHETLKLGYDKINAVLANPPMDDLDNFLGYCDAWAESIKEHHDSEEIVVFPFLNQKMDFSGEEKAHKTIHEILERVIDAIKAAREDISKFEPDDMLKLMSTFREPLFSHLDEEVEHIQAQNLRDANIDEKELAAMIKKLAEHAVSTANPWTMVPYMRSHTPAEYKATWPAGMPWFLRKVVIPYVLAVRYSGYWKYSPYPVA